MGDATSTTVLDREIARVQIEKVRDLCSPVLREVIDEGVGIFERCSQTAPDGDENLGILFPFHHLLEMADGIDVLLAESAVVASHPLLRAVFEALLGIKYVLSEDTARRALSYVVADVKARVAWYEDMDPETDRGKQFRAETGLRRADGFPFPDVEQTRAAKANLEKMLAREPYDELTREFERLRKRRNRKPAWYSLFDGPGNLRELARDVGELPNYDILYRQWSKTTHAADLDRQLTAGNSGAAVRVIRSPIGIETRYIFAINFVLETSRHILEHYRRGELERQSKWYMEKISPQLKRIEAIEVAEEDDE